MAGSKTVEPPNGSPIRMGKPSLESISEFRHQTNTFLMDAPAKEALIFWNFAMIETVSRSPKKAVCEFCNRPKYPVGMFRNLLLVLKINGNIVIPNSDLITSV